MLTNIGFGER